LLNSGANVGAFFESANIWMKKVEIFFSNKIQKTFVQGKNLLKFLFNFDESICWGKDEIFPRFGKFIVIEMRSCTSGNKLKR